MPGVLRIEGTSSLKLTEDLNNVSVEPSHPLQPTPQANHPTGFYNDSDWATIEQVTNMTRLDLKPGDIK